MDKELLKVGFYTIYERITPRSKKYVADNGKIIYSTRFKKYFPNPNRDVKEFNTLSDAKDYEKNKITKYTKDKK